MGAASSEELVTAGCELRRVHERLESHTRAHADATPCDEKGGLPEERQSLLDAVTPRSAAGGVDQAELQGGAVGRMGGLIHWVLANKA